ncbi:hypothetical protein [Arthrobacter yangruifuii]|uniref:hypothetical protein n=1 Tax=Arthrobacter yangruifuii TaxID=2606616 RepID=UPI0011B4D366
MAKRKVLWTLGEAAHKGASPHIELGDRALHAEKDPLVVLIEAGRGTKDDLSLLGCATFHSQTHAL